jgi:acetyl-CoA acetyltransferase
MKDAVTVDTARTPIGVAFKEDDRFNVNGGSIFIGLPHGMAGARPVGHVPIEGKRRGARFVVVSMFSAALWARPVNSR